MFFFFKLFWIPGEAEIRQDLLGTHGRWYHTRADGPVSTASDPLGKLPWYCRDGSEESLCCAEQRWVCEPGSLLDTQVSALGSVATSSPSLGSAERLEDLLSKTADSKLRGHPGEMAGCSAKRWRAGQGVRESCLSHLPAVSGRAGYLTSLNLPFPSVT